MAIQRSYGRIIWNKNMPAFQMINLQSQQFVIYAEPLIHLYNNLNQCSRIKRKDNKESSSSGHYQGEIYASIDEHENKRLWYNLLTIFIGEPTMNMRSGDETELKHILVVQKYYFPKKELQSFVKCIDAMYTQNNHFNMLMMNTDIFLPDEKSLLNL